jgi:hypothetical protein
VRVETGSSVATLRCDGVRVAGVQQLPRLDSGSDGFTDRCKLLERDVAAARGYI